MKNIFYLLVLIIGLNSYAQDSPSLAIYQDARLAVSEDDNGNKPFTLDVLVRAELQGKQFELYYGSLVAEFEYAELYSGDYKRFGFGYQWTFNRWFNKQEYTVGVTTNIIHRFKSSHRNVFALNLDWSYLITDNLKLSLLCVILNREDLRSRYELTDWQDYVKGNGYVGLKYQF